MNSDCEKIRNRITDLVSGILSESQVQTVEQHLDECAGCRDYARALKQEDGLLTDFFAKIETNMTERQEHVLKAINRSGVSKQSDKLSIGRIIMKSPITKLAAAAVIVGAVMLSIHLWDKSTPSAYAFEQTVEAMQGKRSFHIQTYFQQRRKDEFWAEYDENGKVIRYRQEEGKGRYGPYVTLWENDIRTTYHPAGIKMISRIGNTEPELEEFDPETAAKEIHEHVAAGRAIMEIQKPSPYESLITINVTRKDKSLRQVLLVDPDTKLVTRIDNYWGADGEREFHKGIELLEYNQIIDANMFSPEFPEDTITIDQVSQEVGLAQADMSNEEVACEIVRQVLEAWAAADYAKAGKLFGGAPPRVADRASSQLTAHQHYFHRSPCTGSKHKTCVPCEVHMRGQT